MYTSEHLARLADGLATLVSVTERYGEHVHAMQEVAKLMAYHPDQNWLDALSKYQLKSKAWLIEELAEDARPHDKYGYKLNAKLEGTTYVIGGWLGTLPFLMDHLGLPYERLISIDIDPSVREVAEMLNIKNHLDNWKFKAVTFDAYDLNYAHDILPSGNESFPSVEASATTVINTACEHLENFGDWLKDVPLGVRVVLQSNNMFGIDGHVNCKETIDEFRADCQELMSEIRYCQALDMGDSWKRYMIIGTR